MKVVQIMIPREPETMMLSEQLIGVGIQLKQFRQGTKCQVFADRENRQIKIVIGQAGESEKGEG